MTSLVGYLSSHGHRSNSILSRKLLKIIKCCTHLIPAVQKKNRISSPLRGLGENEGVNIIILSYAFKMRQDYLSTSYLDQKYLPSEQSERGRYELIQVTCAEIILHHFESM